MELARNRDRGVSRRQERSEMPLWWMISRYQYNGRVPFPFTCAHGDNLKKASGIQENNHLELEPINLFCTTAVFSFLFLRRKKYSLRLDLRKISH